MKITKRQLRRIIKEEKTNILKELFWDEERDEDHVDPEAQLTDFIMDMEDKIGSEKMQKTIMSVLSQLGYGDQFQAAPQKDSSGNY